MAQMHRRAVAKRGAGLVCVTPSSGNVFADLELPDAVVLDTRLRLAVEINRLIKCQPLAHVTVTERLEVSERTIAALKNYKLDEFSVQCLMNFLLALGRDVEIRITPQRVAGASGRIVVHVT